MTEAGKPFRPVPGKFCVELVQNKIVKIVRYGTERIGEVSSWEYVEVKTCGYGRHERHSLSCVRALTEAERVELGEMVDAGWWG